MSIAVIARFSAAYASLAKLVLVSSRGTSRLGAERALISGIAQVYGIPEREATRFARRLIGRFRKCEERVGAGFPGPARPYSAAARFGVTSGGRPGWPVSLSPSSHIARACFFITRRTAAILSVSRSAAT